MSCIGDRRTACVGYAEKLAPCVVVVVGDYSIAAVSELNYVPLEVEYVIVLGRCSRASGIVVKRVGTCTLRTYPKRASLCFSYGCRRVRSRTLGGVGGQLIN